MHIDLIGKVSLFDLKTSKTFVFASYLLRLSLIKTIIVPEYLAFYLNWNRTQRRLKSIASRSVS